MGNVNKLLCDVYFFPDLNAYKVFFVLVLELFDICLDENAEKE